ncbi:hypothetical protein P154DRAFT_517833 [Amniculicola lignicola CBS 123094]|uniref:Uncharacterized protein n=1 Tax=Amniculicola lignicola CBS 123094 TaxID=1392246 RepID=A0A6A5X1Y1_9PLEO|nr:hypothetical protein P154DRAFT_517833 [Amniculicola lignicola CBS 123094]
MASSPSNPPALPAVTQTESTQTTPQASPDHAANSPTSPAHRSRGSTNASNTSAVGRIRAASIKLMEASPPPGMWAATGSVASKAPSITDLRKGSFSSNGWNEEAQRSRAERRLSSTDDTAKRAPRRQSATESLTVESPVKETPGEKSRLQPGGPTGGLEPFPAVTEEEMSALPTHESVQVDGVMEVPKYDSKQKEMQSTDGTRELSETSEKGSLPHPPIQRQYTNGYIEPAKVPWTTATVIGLKAFWKWFLTPFGFLITVYFLNVVAWGGMLFLLLCNAAPAMCKPSCNHIQSPRRIWIEYDSQILNALFCVTGFGLAPWRFRDLYFWCFWRIGGASRKQQGVRTLAGIHRGWFRLPGSELLPRNVSATTVNPDDPAVPIPHTKIPDAPPTGHHAPPTKGWKMDWVVWMNMWNTLFQIVLCFWMWHYNRYDRPSWATGTFVALGMIVAACGGLMMFHEGKHIKKVEGVPAGIPQERKAGDIEAQNASVQQEPVGTAKV